MLLAGSVAKGQVHVDVGTGLSDIKGDYGSHFSGTELMRRCWRLSSAQYARRRHTNDILDS